MPVRGRKRQVDGTGRSSKIRSARFRWASGRFGFVRSSREVSVSVMPSSARTRRNTRRQVRPSMCAVSVLGGGARRPWSFYRVRARRTRTARLPHVLSRMVVLDAVGHPESSGRAEIAALEDNSFWENHAGIRSGAFDRIPNWTALHLDVLAAFNARLDPIEREVVANSVRPVDLRPRPAQNLPWPADFASEERFDCRALRKVCVLIDQ